MMMNTLYSSILCCSLLFMQMNHPLAMGLTLLLQTMLTCMLIGLMSKSFWFSYILFLIFIGGMLVLFIYVTSLASNELFELSMKLLIFLTLLFMMIMSMLYMNNMMEQMFYNNEMMELSKNLSMINESTTELTKLYNFPTNIITILLMNYLLITLMVIVKITDLFYGPLRMMT